MIEFSHFLSPIGLLSILAVKEGVVKISFENESFKAMEGKFRNHLGMKIAEGTEFTSNAKNQLSKYLSGKSKSLDFPVVHINSSFRKKVLEAERKIPYGQTRSYKEMAQIVRNPKLKDFVLWALPMQKIRCSYITPVIGLSVQMAD